MMTLLPLAPERASRLVSAFSHTQVLVVGDAMLDTFLVGRVTRISPEAPVPVVAFQQQTHRIGGAANVAHARIARSTTSERATRRDLMFCYEL